LITKLHARGKGKLTYPNATHTTQQLGKPINNNINKNSKLLAHTWVKHCAYFSGSLFSAMTLSLSSRSIRFSSSMVPFWAVTSVSSLLTRTPPVPTALEEVAEMCVAVTVDAIVDEAAIAFGTN